MRAHPRAVPTPRIGVYFLATTPQGISAAMSVQELHGITLESILTRLVDHYGWDQLGKRIEINCFVSDPSIKSSLKFLRKTPWARTKVEELYLQTQFTH
jgi:uncharacterized protein (DUF2132 family)